MKYLTVRGCNETFDIARIALGTGSAMKALTKEQVFSVFDAYAAAGGNVFDTAPGYCGGDSERYIGEWIRLHDCRDKVFISTKACHAFPGEPSRLTLEDMMTDLQLSLSQLQTDYIDLFWLHNDDPNIPLEPIIDAINVVVATGRVRAIGCSNWSVERIAAANTYARRNGMYGFWANQIQWSLARVTSRAYIDRYNVLVMDDTSYDRYLKNDVAVFAFSSMAQGFFTVGARDGIEGVREEIRGFYENEGNLKRLERVKAYMQAHDVSASVPVLGYLISNRLPRVAITSGKTPEVIRETMRAADTEMSADEADALFYGDETPLNQLELRE